MMNFSHAFCLNLVYVNQVVWAPVTRNSFQGRTREIPGSIPMENNVWPVRMPLRTSRISRPPLVGRKPVRKQNKKNLVFLKFRLKIFSDLVKVFLVFV
jgi:hypothetical protein